MLAKLQAEEALRNKQVEDYVRKKSEKDRQDAERAQAERREALENMVKTIYR